MWLSNLQLAEKDKCINPWTCEALREFAQWVRVEVVEIRDVPAGMAAAEEAWRVSGSPTSSGVP